MSGPQILLRLTPLEVGVLFTGFGAGVVDDSLDSLGLSEEEKRAAGRVQDKLNGAVRQARRATSQPEGTHD